MYGLDENGSVMVLKQISGGEVFRFLATCWSSEKGRWRPNKSDVADGIVLWPIDVKAPELLTAFRLAAARIRRQNETAGASFRFDDEVKLSDGTDLFLRDVVPESHPDFEMLP